MNIKKIKFSISTIVIGLIIVSSFNACKKSDQRNDLDLQLLENKEQPSAVLGGYGFQACYINDVWGKACVYMNRKDCKKPSGCIPLDKLGVVGVLPGPSFNDRLASTNDFLNDCLIQEVIDEHGIDSLRIMIYNETFAPYPTFLTGMIVDNLGNVVPNASINIAGDFGNIDVVSDFEGNYMLNIPLNSEGVIVITVSKVGYESKNLNYVFSRSDILNLTLNLI